MNRLTTTRIDPMEKERADQNSPIMIKWINKCQVKQLAGRVVVETTFNMAVPSKSKTQNLKQKFISSSRKSQMEVTNTEHIRNIEHLKPRNTIESS